ncbi:F-actin-monooxygenase MICAL3 isoform X7 [Canis lupus familiaris]|uniref:F-actin-monooxygenase MICAL3 isoform X7 n=1 Tax=Canis lupus familiaris TaxID=9615 RepID=UPI0012350030|nr:F-actin-monooxygenase MICAL3 isoform X7 [Canis lupus familiaris]XP_038315478.1 F-actin-monooxygenase MICAL3 isoform X7 [Canis lupus familiaris]XP_038432141.1 F-actin-monooxygenase MICAL3 isoform X7 [Canis lupus familiaris]
MEDSKNETVNHAHVLFDRFVQATTCKGTLKAFQELCDHLELKPKDYRSFYHKLKSKLNYWKAKALWAKLDKRGSHKDYKKGKACTNTKCLIIGAGPCGLRTAIDLSLLGAKVVVIEKRDAFSRNNVLHLWPFTIHDLRGLGAKKFYGKFCAGAIDHISIRQLQLILLKVALILGIEIHVNVEFQGLVQPPEDQENERIGWRALVHPKTHPVSEYEFEVIIGGDGRRNTLEGFRRKEFRGKLAIAITANFINRNTTAEAKVEEISGVAFIFNQKFFQELKEATGIDLENIVYYKDDTHYFVMTAKKQSLLDKGVILHDYADTELLLSRENVDQEALLNYAREAADFSTQQQLPSLDFAINHYGQPDVAMFDFTCMYASENAALVREQNGHQLLVALVGDSLLEPFWPMGTGIARGFLAAMDSAWMVRSWSLGTSPLEVLAERESIYRLLPQTTPENVSKNFSQYSIDPVTRYPNININFLRPSQVRHLYNTGETRDIHLEMENLVNSRTTPKLTRNESVARSSKLLGWCQRQTDGYAGVNVTDLTMSWKSGLALCAIIHRYRPDLIDFDSLDEQNVEKNNQLAFDIAEKELGISPIMTGKEMASVGEPDKLSMVMYLTQFYEMFKDSLPSSDALDLNAEEKAVLIASTKSPISFLSKLGQTISRKRSPKDKKEKDLDGAGKRRKTSQSEEEEAPRGYRGGRPTLVSTLTDRRMDVALGNQNKVKYMATQLLAKFEENAPPQSTGMRRQPTQERGVSQPSCCLPEQGHPAPTPQWKQQQEKERSRTCPKKVITLSPPLTPPPCRAPRSQQTYRDLDADSRGKQSPHHERPEPEPSRRFFVDQWELSLSLRSSNRPASPSSDSLRQKYIKMYTGGVSSLAEQIANQLQRKEQPKTLLDKKELGSIKKEFPQNLGGSDTCYFCRKRVYVMERLSAEGKFFHRSCFKCEYCATTLRLSAYAYDIEDGKFYCKPHYCYRLSGSAQRKRPAVAPLSGKEAREPLQDGPTVDTNGRASAVTSPAERTPGSSVNGVEEPSIAKRLRGTPERIELENYRLSVKQAEELEEVPEETQAEHNLSSVLDTGAEEDVASSSSESEMEEEEEEEPPLPTSDLGGVPWKEAVRIHALLKGKSEEELEASKSFGPGHEEDEEEEEYEEEEEEEEEEYEEEEEEEESSEVGSQRLQQIVNPADPLEIQADVHWTHIREREEEERMVPTSESSTSRVPDLPSIRRAAVQAWLETVSGVPFDENDLEEDVDSEPAKIEGEATENGDTGDTGAELDDDQRWSDGIPSDAETDLRVQHQEAVEADLELRVSENEEEPPEVTPGHPERSLTRVPSPALSPEEQAGLRSPGHSPKAEGAQIPLVSVVTKAKLPEENLFPKPLLPKVKPKVEVPCSQRAACSPIRSQPVALPEARTPTSPVSSQCLSPLATSTPTSTQLPICSQPQPSSETTAPSPTKSPIRLQPVSAKTSIPVVPLPLKNQGDTKDRLGSPLAVDEALKRNDLVAEFWMKSAEIRRSLGLTPVDRSKVYEPSFPSPAFKPVSLKSYAVEKSPEGEGLQLLKPPPVPKRLGLPKSDGDQPFLPTPKSPSDRELKSSQEERRDLSSSSGLGLHGSSSNMKTLGSQSFNTSDSTMLTPPSSPPPPPPQDEEPATLRRKPYQTHEHKDAEPKASVIPPPPPATFMRAPREPTQPLQEEMRKSFVESVDEIPFADDVEDTYDDKTEDSSLQEKFFTPPSYWPRTERPLHPPLAKENGRLPTLESGVQPQKRGLPLVSPEAKELAEERMRAREKSVKSQALRDAMAKQLSKMKEMEMAAGTSSPPGGTSHKASSVPSKGKDLSPESPRRPVLKGPREPALKHEATSEEVLSPPSDSGGPDGSVTSSEGSSGKSKKRSSLFSPRRNKKEKKSKGEGRPPEKPSPSLLEEAAAKPKSLWKSVFSGYKKDKKKKGDDKSCSSTPSSGATVDSGKHKMSPVVRAELHLRRQLSFSEDSDLSSDDILERSSQKSRRESVYVPHALAFKRSYPSKPRTYTEEELNAKLTRRVQKAARRQAKQEELKRLHRAQIIQRQLEQVEEKQRQLEERGVAVEKALRGEAVEPSGGTPRRRPLSFCPCCVQEGMGKKDDPKLMQEWFKLVQEKNAMVRYESELMIFARELELEDRQSRLQQELRERMAVEDHLKTEEELSEEKKILNEMLEVVEQRDALVALLEEQRLREKEEDKDLEAVMLSKGFSLNWS